MKFHIVRSNEKVDEILFMYNLCLDELKENNKYIKRWDKIPAGTKLRIPDITKNDDLEIMEMEPFIEDYYPTLDSVIEKYSYNEVLEKTNEAEEKEEVNSQRNESNTNDEVQERNKLNANEYESNINRQPVGYYYPIYYPYYPNYYNYIPYSYGCYNQTYCNKF